ncbi:MAG: SdpI family protein [Chitinophagaceae bacterium]|nr:SdpI family protein [Chitinophagaceae bacterium]
MKTTTPLSHYIVPLLILLPAIYTATIYASLPETIPTHFNLQGKPDRYGNKSTIWVITLVLGLVSAGAYFLVRNIPKIDPKKAAGTTPELFRKLSVVISCFVCAISLVLIYSTAHSSVNITKMLLPLIGLVFLVVGNYMHSIKPNYFAGFRVPWTLENEDTWRKTHQLMSKYWVAGGFLITVAALLLPVRAGFITAIVILFIMMIVPLIYSYRYYRHHAA